MALFLISLLNNFLKPLVMLHVILFYFIFLLRVILKGVVVDNLYLVFSFVVIFNQSFLNNHLVKFINI